jgi:hypothetical protein
VNLFEDSGGSVDPTVNLTSAQATAYAAAAAVPPAQRTSTESAIVAAGDAALAVIATAWSVDQQALKAAVMTFATTLQADLQRTVRQQVRAGWSENALSEMLAVVTARMISQQRLLLELEARLNASPY